MEGVVFRPNVSCGVCFGASNGDNMMFLCNDHRTYYRNGDGFRPRCHRKYLKAIRCGKKDSMVVLEKGNKSRVDDEKKKNKKIMIKKQKIMIKERTKLLKGLSMDFTGILLDSHKLQLQEASEILLSQLQELKLEHKELKKKMKEEKAKSTAASTCSSSSSSSSESSDSECEKEVLDMNRLKHETYAQPPSSLTIDEEVFYQQPPQIVQENAAVMENYTMPKSEQERDNSLLSLLEEKKVAENSNNTKKIEVCMGGKCKKSGSGELLEEFRRVVGETAPCVDVIGCKCMGKCRDGPNVRLVSTPQAPPIDDFNVGFIDDGLHDQHRQVNLASAVAVTDMNNLSVLARRNLKRAQRPSHPLCIGVGLEDVGFIVSKITGEPIFDQEQC